MLKLVIDSITRNPLFLGDASAIDLSVFAMGGEGIIQKKDVRSVSSGTLSNSNEVFGDYQITYLRIETTEPHSENVYLLPQYGTGDNGEPLNQDEMRARLKYNNR